MPPAIAYEMCSMLATLRSNSNGEFMTNTIKAGLVIIALASILPWAASAHRQHIRKEFETDIANLNANIGKKDLALNIMGRTVESLKKTNKEHNAAVEAMEKSYNESRIIAEREMLAVRRKAKDGEAQYAKLESIAAPFVNIATMTPSAISEEISTCRRAVEINNAFTTQGEVK
jgi:hypothetical protein